MATTEADKLLIMDIQDIKFPREFEEAYSQWTEASIEQSKTPWGKEIPFPRPSAETAEDLQLLRDKWLHSISDLTGEIPLKLPPLRAVNHTIPLIDEKKKYVGHRPRCPEAYQKILQEKIEKYVTAGWWEFAPVDNALPMLCLPKDGARLRTVIDLRERNNNTVHDITPMPDQDRIRQDVARGTFRSKLDMSDAYEQIRIVEDDVHKTAFSTIVGTMRSRVMQQGDCNAPSTFQRLMTHIFRKYIGIFVHVYLDDIFIFSSTREAHEQHLELVFNALRDNKMYLSKKKVDIYSTRMDCLGHIIDDLGIHAESDKLEAIREWRTPRNYHDVSRFLGLVQYLAQFMPKVSDYMSPLSAMCTNGAPFQWRPEHDKCFETIKALACKAPILRPIDANDPEPIWVVCDASKTGVGAYYGQGPTWQTARPAGFMSKKLTNAQMGYATYEHETIAILEALLKWEDQLLGRRIQIVTDHRTLEFFDKQRDMSYRQRRWSDYLSRFDKQIHYIKGETNVVADALSRYYKTDSPEEQHAAYKYVNADICLDPDMDYLPSARKEELARITTMRLPEQHETRHEEATRMAAIDDPVPPSIPGPREDPIVYESSTQKSLATETMGKHTQFLETVENAYATDVLFSKVLNNPEHHKAFVMKNNLIYTRNRVGDDVLCIPKGQMGARAMREIIIDTAHDLLGHFGSLKVIDYVRKFYWWDRLAADIVAFCESCHVCQSIKTINAKPQGLLHSLPVPEQPWSSISMDFLGPFPRSNGYDYLWVIVCRLTGMTHLMPCTTKTRASELAYTFLKEIVRLHGVPASIVLDRDSKFNSKFWKELHRLMGTKLLMSTAFHPQTDGLTERVNRSVSQVLRAMIKPDQTNWAEQLPLAEFALNSCSSETTGFSPFELNYGFTPRTIAVTMSSTTPEGVRQFADHAQMNLEQAHDAIISARVRQTHHANKKRSEQAKYTVGQLAYLSTENLQLPLQRARKLAPKFIGPFEILEVHESASVVRLKLPPDLARRNIHPKFHMSRIRPYVENNDALFPNRAPTRFYDFGNGDSVDTEEYVNEIVSHCWDNETVLFLVRWTLGSSSWEPWEVVQDLEAIDNYFELQDVTSWQDLPKVTKPIDIGSSRRATRRRSGQREPLSRPADGDSRIVWRLTPGGIKIRYDSDNRSSATIRKNGKH
jgi:hypothetical protein